MSQLMFFNSPIPQASGNDFFNLDLFEDDLSAPELLFDSADEDESSDEDIISPLKKLEKKPTTNEKLAKKREKNRILARQTRQRKKLYIESLNIQLDQFTKENIKLKEIIKSKLDPKTTQEIFSRCTSSRVCLTIPENSSTYISTQPSSPPIPSSGTLTTTHSLLQKTHLSDSDYRLMSLVQAAQRSFVITDPSLPDNPIIFAAPGFIALTGYSLDMILGRNCRFLQGPQTSLSQVESLRVGITGGQDSSAILLNYRASGSVFYNQVFVAALRDIDQRIVNFVGVQVELSEDEYTRYQNMQIKPLPSPSPSPSSSSSSLSNSSSSTFSSSSSTSSSSSSSSFSPSINSCFTPFSSSSPPSSSSTPSTSTTSSSSLIPTTVQPTPKKRGRPRKQTELSIKI